MHRIGSPRDIRIREMAGFKAFIEVDLADEASRKPYRELYDKYIEGEIDDDGFDDGLKRIAEHYRTKKALVSEETEMQLTADEMNKLFA